MRDPLSYKLVVISDLHLSEGWDEDGFLARTEDFFFDQSFRRFTERLCDDAKKGCFFYRLIINGDFVDFLQFTSIKETKEIEGEILSMREQIMGPGTTEKKTLWKLKRLIDGHSVFFHALADFVARGNELLIIPGNHDIEWIMPSVQKAFKEALLRLATSSNGMEERIEFSPWFYWDSLLSVFIEHGSQYDDINSFDYLPCPYRQNHTIDLPAGSFFVRYLFNRLEEIYPFADNMKPMSKFILWALTHRKIYVGWPPGIVRFIQFFVRTLGKAGPIEKGWGEKLKIRQEKELRNLADQSGLPEEVLTRLRVNWIPSALHHKCWPSLALRFFTNAELDKYYYRTRAELVHEAVGARYIIFGHTHEADLFCLSPICSEGKKDEYVNSGCWTKCFAGNPEEALLKGENEFVYVHIGCDEEKGGAKMDLLRWDDGLQEGERVRLFR